MRDGLERNIDRFLLLPGLNLVLLLLRGGGLGLFFRGFLVLGRLTRCLSLSTCGRCVASLSLFLRRSFRFGFGSSRCLDGDLLFFGPVLTHFDAFEDGDLVDVVLNTDAELGCAAWHISLGALATTDVIASN